MPLTPRGYRYADCTALPSGGGAAAAVICVREDHTIPARVQNTLVRLPLSAGGAGDVLYADSDFVAYPRPSPDGKLLAFISWDHPNMPWDATELKVARLTADGIGEPLVIAGGPTESVMEPQWDIDGTLYFISDRSGYWNLYAWHAASARVQPGSSAYTEPGASAHAESAGSAHAGPTMGTGSTTPCRATARPCCSCMAAATPASTSQAQAWSMSSASATAASSR